MIVKIKNLSNNELPSYQTEGAAGVDLRANLPDSNITLRTHPCAYWLILGNPRRL